MAYNGPLKLVIPLTSRAKLEDMSLFTAIELLPEPNFTFRFKDTSELNKDDPITLTVDPLNVS